MTIPICLLTLFCFIFLSPVTMAQFDIGETIKKKVEKEAEEEIEGGVDKGWEAAEDAVKEGVSGDEDMDEPVVKEPSDNPPVADPPDTVPTNQELKVWSKYDFVAGDVIIFEDNLAGEQNGEFPSKWDLVKGNAENALLGEQNVISFVQNQTEITPLMKNESYLPDIFTIEFDVYFYQKGNEAYVLRLTNLDEVNIRLNKVSMGQFVGDPGPSAKDVGWHHIAVSFNKRSLKVYFDQTRALNVPNVKSKPTAFTVRALSRSSNPALLSNIRIAEGGVKLYDRLQTDGKIVTRGILFDVGKSTIKPESMGIIREIAELMEDHPDVSFSIEGHTDSDGADEFNLDLSRQRAAAVMAQLVNLGISELRMASKGWGESTPVAENNTPEGKANNRRVEFVKM